MQEISVLIPLAEGFEEVEAITLIDLLRRAEFKVVTVSISSEKLVKGAHDISVESDKLLSEVTSDKFDAIILPGGMPGTLNLKASETLKTATLAWVLEGSAYGAICAAPTVLSEWGLMDDLNCTCYPAFKDQLGPAKYSSDKVVIDGNVITSQGVGTAIDYACAWVKYFKTPEDAEVLKRQVLAN